MISYEAEIVLIILDPCQLDLFRIIWFNARDCEQTRVETATETETSAALLNICDLTHTFVLSFYL